MSKRALGSVFQRKQDQRWVARVTLPDGKRVTRYAKDRAEAEQILAQLLTTPDLVPAAPYTVGTWLDEYLKRANTGRAPATVYDRANLAGHIKADLGKVRLDKLTAAHVQRFIDGRPSHRSQLKSLQLLRSALDEAQALGHLTRNPAAPVKPPRRAARKAGQSWTREEARAFLDANQGTAYAPLWGLALHTGARIGELLALKVSDYRPDDQVLRIERTLSRQDATGRRDGVGRTKTESGTRNVPLSASAQAAIEAQLDRRTADRDEGWLFCTSTGTMYNDANIRREWNNAIKRAGVPSLRMHDMRVTFISLALQRGVKPEVVAKMVGHSSPLITLRIYRIVFQDELDDTRAMLAELV